MIVFREECSGREVGCFRKCGCVRVVVCVYVWYGSLFCWDWRGFLVRGLGKLVNLG